jgi:hypothetical protein
MVKILGIYVLRGWLVWSYYIVLLRVMLQYTWIAPGLLPEYRFENNLGASDHDRCSPLVNFSRRSTSSEVHVKRHLGFCWSCCDHSEIAILAANSSDLEDSEKTMPRGTT